tara:strand:- start:3 stop:248 length:246 start_codon:yes stop_codon:yes gene_type:complete
VPNRFKPGDLVILNQYGLFITLEHERKLGIIISKSYNILPPDEESEIDTFFIVYDILLDGELIKMVPEEFMEMYGEYEEDT